METIAGLLAQIERLPAVEMLKASFVAYPLINAAHVLAIGALVTSVVLMDLRILGFLGRVRPGIPVLFLRRVALAAFAVAALAGIAMFSVRARDYAVNPAFIAKMVLVLLALVNFLIFIRLAGKSSESPDQGQVPIGAKAAAALSILLWVGVVLCGRFIAFV